MERKTIKQIPKIDRPRERLMAKGVANLKDAELLAILLSTGIEGKNVLEIAQDILNNFSKKKLLKLNFKQLSALRGVGQAKACLILSAFELAKRAFNAKDELVPLVQGVDDVVAQTIYMKDKLREHFMVLFLNARNELLSKKPMFVGTLNANLVHPREIFSEALRQNAAFVIFCHNHPSGAAEPSQVDLNLTKRLVEAGKIMGVEVLDHIIITKTKVFSFKEQNLI